MKLDISLLAGETLHIFQKPVGGGSKSVVTLTQSDQTVTHLAGPASLDFNRTEADGLVAGPASLDFNTATTDLSLVYAYDPATVMTSGIRTLYTTERNRPDLARHRLHLAPPFGWMNDPNGLSESAGLTHVFYQHYPHTHRWNTMHWGHAVSRNRIDWVHLPIFLLPRADLLAEGKIGGAFSGSVLPMTDGTGRVFYTDREDIRLPDWEWQMTAISKDWIDIGPSTAVAKGTPDLPTIGRNIRDPYVFKGPDGQLKMLLGAGDDAGGLILLYGTADPTGASGWEFLNVLHREPSNQTLPSECPCMVALDGEGEGLHALIFGLLGHRDEVTRRRNVTFAVVGQFDGRNFEPIERFEMDFGTDCYAFQGIVGADGPYGIAWAANWTDVFKDRDYPSAMTFPRRLVWTDGYLSTPPIEAVTELRTHLAVQDLMQSQGLVPLQDGLGEIELILAEQATPFKVVFDHPTHAISLVYDGSTLQLHFQPPGERPVPRYSIDGVALTSVRIFVDVGLIEIYADEGRWCLTKRLESSQLFQSFSLEADGGSIRTARLWALRSQSATA
jgi:beta-fructofuranosidase